MEVMECWKKRRIKRAALDGGKECEVGETSAELNSYLKTFFITSLIAFFVGISQLLARSTV